MIPQEDTHEEQTAPGIVPGTTLDAVILQLHETVRSRLGYDRAAVFLVDHEREMIEGRWGTDAEGRLEQIRDQRFPLLPNSSQLARVALREIPYWITNRFDQEVGAAHVRPDMRGVAANLNLPLLAGDRVVGILAVDTKFTGRSLGEADVERLRPFLDMAGVAIAAALEYEASHEQYRRLRLLHRVTQRLADRDPLEDRLLDVAEALAEALAVSRCAIMKVQKDALVGWVAFGGSEDESSRYQRLVLPLSLAPTLADTVVRKRRPFVVGGRSGHPITDRELTETWQLRCALFLPMVFQSQVEAVAILYEPGEECSFPPDRILLGQAVAANAAAAIRAATQAHRQEEIVSRLQERLLSNVPRVIAGLETAHAYYPALHDLQVGGDFYDAIRLPDGRVALVIGDVAGKGERAAVRTAEVKYLLRGLLFSQPGPAEALAHVNNVLCRSGPMAMDDLVSVFVALYDPEVGTLTMSGAGHPPPLLVRAGGAVEWLASEGMILGFDHGREYPERQVPLAPGDVLVFYTDGVTEAGRGGEQFGEAGLAGVVVERRDAAPRVLLQAVFEAAQAWAGRLHDDVALLAVKRR